MTANDALARLIGHLRAGEDAAAREIFERFTGRLVALACHQVDALVQHQVDFEGMAPSAGKSFFLREREGPPRAEKWDGLWGLLTLLTLRQCADRVEHFPAGKRDARPDVAAAPGQDDDAWRESIDREPTPMEAAMLHETIKHLHRQLTVPERLIFQLSLQGYTAREIGQRLGRAEHSVRRLRDQIRRRLERLQGEA